MWLYLARSYNLWWKELGTAGEKHSTTERECLGIIMALKHFEHYLRGVPMTITTDHATLKWLLSQNEPKGRIARWVAFSNSDITQLSISQGRVLGMLMR